PLIHPTSNLLLFSSYGICIIPHRLHHHPCGHRKFIQQLARYPPHPTLFPYATLFRSSKHHRLCRHLDHGQNHCRRLFQRFSQHCDSNITPLSCRQHSASYPQQHIQRQSKLQLFFFNGICIIPHRLHHQPYGQRKFIHL